MNKEFENIFIQLNEFMRNQGDTGMSEVERQALISDFIRDYNESIEERMTPDKASTSDDYLELASYADNPKDAKRYAKKALRLDPDNLDAERFLADMSTDDPILILREYGKIKKHADEIMEKEGFMSEEYIGSFWGILETRPYMRVRYDYMRFLIDCGMFRLAAGECEDLLRLCEGDNLGVRYILMHLYAYLEEEKKLLELYERYENERTTQMLLPLSILYFKMNDLVSARKYLNALDSCNHDTRRFIKAVDTGNTSGLEFEHPGIGYRPNTIEDFLTEFTDCFFLFDSSDIFFSWANETLRPKKKVAAKNKK